MNDCGMVFQQIGQCLQAVGIEAHEAVDAFGDICYVTAATLEEATFSGNRKKNDPTLPRSRPVDLNSHSCV